MTVFVVQPENPLKFGVLIDAFHGGARMPALLISGAASDSGREFPVETHGVASNIASLLNGAPAQKTLSSEGDAIHYHRHSHGVTLHHRDPAQGGVSTPGLHITIVESLPAEKREAVMAQLTPAFMKNLCGSIDMAPRADHAHGTAPKQGPQI